MNELRAPDPTLTALGRRGVLVEVSAHPPLVAHGFDGIGAPPPCGDQGTHRLVSADTFAYIAIPCRECFPDAPPPGHRSAVHGEWTDSNLAWQVTP